MTKLHTLCITLLIFISTIALTSCSSGTKSASTFTKDGVEAFVAIDEYRVYSCETKVVFYMFGQRIGGGSELFEDPVGYGFMSPYISENGYFCRYEDERIVEIIDGSYYYD